MKSTAELAHRIETGIETKSGRYDWASKVEVLAFVKQETAKLERELRLDISRRELALREEMNVLQNRITELEMPWWKRLAQRVRGIA